MALRVLMLIMVITTPAWAMEQENNNYQIPIGFDLPVDELKEGVTTGSGTTDTAKISLKNPVPYLDTQDNETNYISILHQALQRKRNTQAQQKELDEKQKKELSDNVAAALQNVDRDDNN